MVIDPNEFENIRPYSDEEAVQALKRVAANPLLGIISKYLYPREDPAYLSKMTTSVKDVTNFQWTVMYEVVTAILAKTAEGFTVSGVENIRGIKGRFLAVSNHRDIVLDPALLLYAIKDAGMDSLELCVGNNLLQNQMIEDLMRSNRMITVIRGTSAREIYSSSKILSKYIRHKITTGESSVWIAQREGRTKNGLDCTEQGVLKMFDMSGERNFEDNFNELNLVPISISYEYEPCDSRKAREILIKKTTGRYVKKKNEDTHSIMTGITQRKGHIHLHFGTPLSPEEIRYASKFNGNDRYQAIMHIMDDRITEGYQLFKTNYMGYDLMNGTSRFLGIKYLPEDLDRFKEYVNHKLGKLESRLDRNALEDIFLHIYGNPVCAKVKV